MDMRNSPALVWMPATGKTIAGKRPEFFMDKVLPND